MTCLPRDYAQKAGELVEFVALSVERKFEALCESPIETTFLITFKLVAGMVGEPVQTVVGGVPQTADHPRGWFIEPQFKIGDYRVDFAIGRWPKSDGKLLIIECDGHDFHERTKEQAARDRKRDRYLQSLEHKVLRFTGMEIHRNPFDCACEVIGEMTKMEPT